MERRIDMHIRDLVTVTKQYEEHILWCPVCQERLPCEEEKKLMYELQSLVQIKY